MEDLDHNQHVIVWAYYQYAVTGDAAYLVILLRNATMANFGDTHEQVS